MANANDVTIIAGIFFIMFATALILPFVQVDFDVGATENNATGLYSPESTTNINVASATISWFQVLVSLTKMFFWYFGNLPLWLNTFFIALKIIFYVLIYRQIRSGGG